MSEAKHTPGPWHCEQGGYMNCAFAIRSIEHHVATVANHRPEMLYDVKLITAAPDLLAALEKLIDSYPAAQRPTEYGWHDAIVAVKRAKGE